MLHKITAALIAFGPLGVFLLSVADSIGVPLPAALDFLLVTLAAASVHNPARAYFAAALAVVGSVLGNAALFLAARHGCRLFGTGKAPPGRKRRFREWVSRYGLLAVFIPAVTPVVPLPLKVCVISAGAMHAPLGRFLLVILVARAIRYFAEVYLGILLGADARGFLLRHGWTLAGIAAGFVVLAYLLMRAGANRSRDSKA